MWNNQRYEIRKQSSQTDEFTLILYMDDYLTEFSSEPGVEPKEKNFFLTIARQIVREQYPNIKVTMVKVLMGDIAVAAIPLTSHASFAKAAERTSALTTQVAQSSTIFYQVSSGDTLFKLSVKFGTSVDFIKKANNLNSDVLQINQRLIIPKAIHTVGTGDYLTVLAKQYGTTIDAIKEANGLTSDATRLGQTLIIPIPMVMNNQPSVPAPSVAPSTSQQQVSNYTVVSGESLSVIAKHFGITIDALRGANNLTSDIIKIWQILKIPANGTSIPGVTGTMSPPAPTVQNPVNTTVPPSTNTTKSSYTVVAGDTLSGIAKKNNLSADSIKQANQLTTDTIRIGQILTIPVAPTLITNVNLTSVQKNLQTLGYYSITTMTGGYDTATTQAVNNFQKDYGLPVTGIVNAATSTALNHAVVKQAIIKDTANYVGVPYVWGGTTPAGFDCSGFVYYVLNQHGITMSRTTSAVLYSTGIAIDRTQLQPGDLVFFAINTTGTISHVGFYIGNNQFISATSSKGIAVVSMDNTYWAQYYVGANRVY